MSELGIGIAAQVFQHMQTARHRLFLLGTKYNLGSEASKQDIMLAQLLETMKDAGKHAFAGITLMKVKEKKSVKAKKKGRVRVLR